MNAAMLKTLTNVTIAFVPSVLVGVASASPSIAAACCVRQGLEPLFATYYAIPVYAFYPLFIILFGLGDTPQIMIGFMLAVVAVIVNTLSGLDRVPARADQNRARPIAWARSLPRSRSRSPRARPIFSPASSSPSPTPSSASSAPSSSCRSTGLGYEISFAYNNFDNTIMYPLILLIIVISTAVNMTLSHWEKTLMQRRGQR